MRMFFFFGGASWAGNDGGLQKVSWLAGFQTVSGVIFFYKGSEKKTHGKVWRSEKIQQGEFSQNPLLSMKYYLFNAGILMS